MSEVFTYPNEIYPQTLASFGGIPDDNKSQAKKQIPSITKCLNWYIISEITIANGLDIKMSISMKWVHLQIKLRVVPHRLCVPSVLDV